MRLTFLKPLASLKLTVFCLLFGFVLVLAGTFAQVHISNYEAQVRYFNAWIVFWSPEGSHWKIPVFPGGWLIGGVLLVNLVVALILRFQFSAKKMGLWMSHLGIIVLLVGEFAAGFCKTESYMRIEMGQTLNYSEDFTKNELVFIDTSPKDHDDIISVSETALLQGGDLKNPKLPFTIRVRGYYPNSTPMMLSAPESSSALKTTNGIGNMLCFANNTAPIGTDQDAIPAILIELLNEKGSMGTWLLSTWLTKPKLAAEVQNWLGDTQGVVAELQSFTYSNRLYQIALRPKRYYKTYSLKLLEFKHEIYTGSSIPKNFASRVHLSDPARGENRDILIYMNNPLRYHGETFYQSSFESGDTVTVLQDVRNPVSITPYVASAMVGLGLLFHFLMHLTGFFRKRAETKL